MKDRIEDLFWLRPEFGKGKVILKCCVAALVNGHCTTNGLVSEIIVVVPILAEFLKKSR
jgi:hypothetical protein